MKKAPSSALLIVDVLNDFLRGPSPVYAEDLASVISPCRKLLAAAREQGIPVMFLCDSHQDLTESCPRRWGPHAMIGTPGAEVVSELAPRSADVVVCKAVNDAFFRSDLEEKLRHMSISELYIAGVQTSFCIRATTEAALNRDYHVTVIKDCVADESKEMHELGLTLIRAVHASIQILPEVIDHWNHKAR